jgi:hypothetical protein
MTHKNNRFHHQISTKTATKWKPSPQHKSATAIKGMVETHSFENDAEWTGVRGLNLMKNFEGVLRDVNDSLCCVGEADAAAAAAGAFTNSDYEDDGEICCENCGEWGEACTCNGPATITPWIMR